MCDENEKKKKKSPNLSYSFPVVFIIYFCGGCILSFELNFMLWIFVYAAAQCF